MIRYLVSGLAGLLLVAPPAFAAAPKESGFFVGGAYGVTKLDDDGAFNWLEFDDSDSSLTVFAGYKFFRYFAVEARYGDLGSYRLGNGVVSETIDFKLLSAHAVGIVPIGQSGWELYGQLGIGSVDIGCSGCGDETVGSAGLGVRYSPLPNLSVGLQLDAYAWEEDPGFDFAITSTQLVLRYQF